MTHLRALADGVKLVTMKLPGAVTGLLWIALIIAFMAAAANGTTEPETVRIGVLAKRGLDHCRAKWDPTAAYLSKTIPGHRFSIVPLDFSSVQQAVANHSIDFILTNSSFHVELEDQYGVNAIATLINRMHCGDHKVFGGVIFSRVYDAAIRTLADLRGKDFMAVKESSFGGWRMAWREMKASGMDPRQSFKSISFGGTHDAVVLAVLNGKVDAGTVRTDTLERMAAEGKIDLSAFRVLNINRAARDSLGIKCSTRLYPEWPMAKLTHTADKLSEMVSQALFRMKDASPAAVAAKCAGWTYPLSYHPVHDCLEELQLGPYDPKVYQSISAVYRRHKAWFLSGGLAFFLLLVTAAGVSKLNARLSSSNSELLDEIKKRKLSESQLYESEARLQNILDQSIAGVFIIDPDTHVIVDANQSALDMVGADRPSVVGRKCPGFICQAAEGQCPVTDQGERFNRTERRLIRSDGSHRTVLKTVTQFSLKGKDLLLDSFIDISELKETQYSLESALYAANEANKAKDQFLANMSHELRTPMNGIIGMTNILQNTDLSKEQTEFAQIIMKSSEGLLGIINDILDFAHIETADPQLECIDIDLHALIDRLMTSIIPSAREKGLACSHAIDDGVPGFLRGDRRRIKRILDILVDNAVKFTSRGGVSLHLSKGPESDNKCTIHFKVSDTGIGIETDRIDHIFTPFTQADYSTTRKYGGIGLGLALAKHFTEMMGGQIQVESTPEHGSTFTVTLCLEVQTTIPVRKRPRLQNLNDYRILVADDDPTSRQVLKEFLSSWQVQYQIVDGARAALAALKEAAIEKTPYDVAIINHIMSDMHGMDLGRVIKQDPLISLTKMILFTAMDQACNTDQIRDVGFDAFLAKPIGFSRLFDCLSIVCNRGDHDQTASQAVNGFITQAALSEVQATGPRILVVEDNVINQKVMLKILQKNGCQPDVVDNGREAVERLSRKSYDLVLMDIQMPVMNGFEATSAIRNPSNNCLDPQVPIIAVTANAMKDPEKACLEAGMDDYLPKPVIPEILISKVRQWCDKVRMVDPSGIGYWN